MLRVWDDGSDRAVSDSASERGTRTQRVEQLPEQGYVQQAIRNDDRPGVRKRIGVIRRFFSG
jgi:hypothetical protein